VSEVSNQRINKNKLTMKFKLII